MGNRQGYTLVELLVVIMAMSILSAPLVVSSLAMYDRFSLHQTTRMVSSALSHLQLDSQLHHRRNQLELTEISYGMQQATTDYFRNSKLQNPQTIAFNAHGHVTMATTLVFVCRGYEQAIVVWLGGGFHEVQAIQKRVSID